MVKLIDGTKVAPHGMFYMESAGGCHADPEDLDASSSQVQAHQPSCFALEEERGWDWKGAGGAGKTIKDARPTL